MIKVDPMRRYYFSLENERPFDDVDGLELADMDAVRKEATGFARDVMRIYPEHKDWSTSFVCVTDERHQPVFKLAFMDVE